MSQLMTYTLDRMLAHLAALLCETFHNTKKVRLT
jgi:hypothetical protein